MLAIMTYAVAPCYLSKSDATELACTRKIWVQPAAWNLSFCSISFQSLDLIDSFLSFLPLTRSLYGILKKWVEINSLDFFILLTFHFWRDNFYILMWKVIVNINYYNRKNCALNGKFLCCNEVQNKEMKWYKPGQCLLCIARRLCLHVLYRFMEVFWYIWIYLMCHSGVIHENQSETAVFV